MKRSYTSVVAEDLVAPADAACDAATAAAENKEEKCAKLTLPQIATVTDDATDNDELSASTFIAPRLGKCEVCAANDARYSCPKCEVKTCSLRCIQIHKKELECDGVRDRTKFIPLRKMTKMDFMSDYYFLEECTRYVEDRKNDRIKRFTRYNKSLPTHLFRLRAATAARGTTLRFLLSNFTRHKENTTYLDWKERKIYWRVEWIFANAGGLLYIDKRCDEDLVMHKLLDKYLNPHSLTPLPERKSLEYYQSAGINRVKLLLKAEGIKCSRNRFFALDINKTLKQNLTGKTLVEFPRIYLSYEQSPAGCEIIDSDEDIESETKTHQVNMEALRKKQLEATKNEDIEKSFTSGAADAVREAEELKRLITEKRREERLRKRTEFESAPNNYLFADERLWEMLSTSSSGNDTEEENNI